MSGSVELLGKAGVAVYDSAGNMKNVGEILDDLGGKFSNLNNETQQQIGLQLAGRFQLSRFLTLMQQYEQAQLSTSAALNSHNSAINENSRYLDSHEARINKMKNSFTSAYVAIGESFANDAIVIFVESVTGAVKAVASLIDRIGAMPVILSAISPLFLLMNKGLSDFIVNGNKYSKTQTVLTNSSKKFKGVTVAQSLATKHLTHSTNQNTIAQQTNNASVRTATVVKTPLITSTRALTVAKHGLTVAVRGATIAFRGLLAATGVGVGLMAIGYVIEKVTKSIGDSRREAAELDQEIKNLTKTYGDNAKEVDRLVDTYDRLSNLDYLSGEQEKEYLEVQQKLYDIMPHLADEVDEKGRAHLRSADAIRKEISALEDLRGLESKQFIEDFDELVGEIEDDIEKAQNKVKELNYVTIDGGFGVVVDNHYDENKELSLEEQAKKINYEREQNREVERLADNYKKLALAKAEDHKISLIDSDKQYINTLIEENEELMNTAEGKEELKEKIDSLVGSVGNLRDVFGSTFDLTPLLDNGQEYVFYTEDQLSALSEVNDALQSGGSDWDEYSDKLTTVGIDHKIASEFINGTKESFEKMQGAIDLGLFTDMEGKFPIKSTSHLNQLNEEGATLYNAHGQAVDSFGNALSDTTDELDKNFSALSAIMGVTADTIDRTYEMVAIYQTLSNVQNLNEEQTKSLQIATQYLANTYPHLVDGSDLKIEAMIAEARQNDILRHATNELANGKLSAENAMTLASATETKNRIQNMNTELQAMQKLADFYDEMAKKSKNAKARMYAEYGEDRAQSEADALIRELDLQAPSLDGLIDKLAEGSGYQERIKSPSSTDSSKSSEEKQIDQYIPDKYAKRLESLSAQLDHSKHKMSRFAEGTKEYNGELAKQISLIEEMQAVRHEENNSLRDRNALIKQALPSYKEKGYSNLSDEHKERFNELTKELEENTKQINANSSAWWDNQEAIENTNMLRYNSLLAETTHNVSDLTFELNLSKSTMALAEEGTKDYFGELTKQQGIIQKLIAEESNRQKTLENILSTQRLTIDQEKEYRKQLQETILTQKDYQQELQGMVDNQQDRIEQLANEVVNMYKRVYEEQKKASLNAIDDEMKALDKAHDKKMDMLDEEISAYEDVVNAKLKALDKEESEDDYNKRLEKAELDQQDTRSKIDKLSLSNDIADRNKRKELEEELAKSVEEINEMKLDRQRELRRENLQEELATKKKEVDKKKESLNTETDLERKALEEKRKLTERHWENLINDERKWAAIRSQIMSGNFTEMENAFLGFANFVKANSEEIGESISQNMQDEMKKLVTDTKLATEEFINLKNALDEVNTKQAKLEQMQRNSAAWKGADSQERDRLHSENKKLGAELGLVFDSATGVWSDPSNTSSGSNSKSTLDKMKANSAAWSSASAADKKKLEQDNQRLGAEAGLTYDSRGYWLDKEGNRVYHNGGIVGGKKSSKIGEIVDKLFNTKNGEVAIKALEGEVMIPPKNLSNGIDNIRSMIHSTKVNQPSSQITFNPSINVNVSGKMTTQDTNNLVDDIMNRFVHKMKPYGVIR